MRISVSGSGSQSSKVSVVNSTGLRQTDSAQYFKLLLPLFQIKPSEMFPTLSDVRALHLIGVSLSHRQRNVPLQRGKWEERKNSNKKLGNFIKCKDISQFSLWTGNFYFAFHIIELFKKKTDRVQFIYNPLKLLFPSLGSKFVMFGTCRAISVHFTFSFNSWDRVLICTPILPSLSSTLPHRSADCSHVPSFRQLTGDFYSELHLIFQCLASLLRTELWKWVARMMLDVISQKQTSPSLASCLLNMKVLRTGVSLLSVPIPRQM